MVHKAPSVAAVTRGQPREMVHAPPSDQPELSRVRLRRSEHAGERESGRAGERERRCAVPGYCHARAGTHRRCVNDPTHRVPSLSLGHKWHGQQPPLSGPGGQSTQESPQRNACGDESANNISRARGLSTSAAIKRKRFFSGRKCVRRTVGPRNHSLDRGQLGRGERYSAKVVLAKNRALAWDKPSSRRWIGVRCDRLTATHYFDLSAGLAPAERRFLARTGPASTRPSSSGLYARRDTIRRAIMRPTGMSRPSFCVPPAEQAAISQTTTSCGRTRTDHNILC